MAEDVSILFWDEEPDPAVLHRLYDAVLAPSFLPAEREPVKKLSQVLSTGDLRGAIAVRPNGEPVGALFLEWFSDIRAALLCYFAVRPDLRGQGIGRKLVGVAPPHWLATLEPQVFFAEAQDPRAAGILAGADSGSDYGDRDARLRLYARFGLRRLPIPYLMPELMPGAGRLANLLLLVAEPDHVVSPAPDRIRSTIVEDFLVRYFARHEGRPVPAEDGQFQQLLAECRQREFLPLLALSE